MATTKSNTTVKKNTNRKTTPKTADTTETIITEDIPKKYVIKTNLDPLMVVTVKSGFEGKLIYKSKRTGEIFEWESFGDEQDMELGELKNAKNSVKAFFKNNWFFIDDPEVIEYLGVGEYYKNALTYEDFDEIFTLPPEEIIERVSKLSDGQKRVLVYRSKKLIASGDIDSNKVIKALEESLGVELIEN